MEAGLPLLLQENATSYLYGPGGMVLEQIQDSGTTGTPYYYHADQLGSIRALTNQAGTVVATYVYDAYGSTTASTGSVANPFRYAGEYQDAESGLYYLRARYYDPATQQFLTRDPLVAATEQAYNYAAGSPLNATDPSGFVLVTEDNSGGGWGLSPADMIGFGMAFSLGGGGGGAGSGNGYLGRRSGWSPVAQEAEAADEGELVQVAPATPARRVHARYEDGTPVYEDEQPPRLGSTKPDEDAEGAHCQLRWDDQNKRVYQGREFDDSGKPVRDIDFTSPTFPNGNPRPGHLPPPHQHRWLDNPTGGSYKRSKTPEPYDW